MSNSFSRKSDFIPAVYTRYFERTETRKSSHSHIFFDDNIEETSKNYQIKRDLIFKRLFPSKYADSNNNNSTENEHTNQNENNTSLNKAAQSLGDFIPLSNINSSSLKKTPSLETDVILSSSDENEEDLLLQEQLPSSTHDSIIGHLHPRSTIENVRTILIRELYQRTSDAHTEWLKCKMNLPKEYVNPKYYADFQRRYRKEIKKNTSKKKKSNSTHNNTENGYHIFDLTTNDESKIQINNISENDDIIETSSTKPVNTTSSSSPILINDSPIQSKSIPEFIILDSDEDNNDNTNDNLSQDNNNSTYFIDRSSTSFTAILQPTETFNEDYHKEDSKYAQLPSRNTSSESIIRPIISKHQRRKQNTSTKPLVSAIDRIIDQIDQTNPLENSTVIEQQNLLMKQIKKRKKKKKKKLNNATIN
ncbi:unnamed protein product [Rotaria sp. Silwood1]|nr:unnamed protein product [Rotaria sp. Silwood1]